MIFALAWTCQTSPRRRRALYKLKTCLEGDGESAGARTQDQRLKRAMLYQLSYALKPHYQVSTFRRGNLPRDIQPSPRDTSSYPAPRSMAKTLGLQPPTAAIPGPT